jgi:hypothetical protein
MAKIRKTSDGEVIYTMDLTKEEVHAISYALDIASEVDDTYDVETHDYLQEFFGEMWDGGYDEEGPEEFSGYSTSISLMEEDAQGVILDFNEKLTKHREAHWDEE